MRSENERIESTGCPAGEKDSPGRQRERKNEGIRFWIHSPPYTKLVNPRDISAMGNEFGARLDLRILDLAVSAVLAAEDLNDLGVQVEREVVILVPGKGQLLLPMSPRGEMMWTEHSNGGVDLPLAFFLCAD